MASRDAFYAGLGYLDCDAFNLFLWQDVVLAYALDSLAEYR